MVIEDLSFEPTTVKLTRNATVADRLLSSAVDISLFWPLFSLVLSPLLRKLQSLMILGPDSKEATVLLVLVTLSYLALTVLTQSLCWSLWGATPGQRFFQIRVTQEGSSALPSFHSSLLRSVLFCVEVACLGIPFLEVFSHRDRRCFHDRAAETRVITLKKQGAPEPLAFEGLVVRNVFTLTLLMALSWATAFGIFTYRKIQLGAFREGDLIERGELCEEVPSRGVGARMDRALGLFLTGGLSVECLESEIDFAFWKGSANEKTWASAARVILSQGDADLEGKYLEQVCADSSSLACEFSLFWSGDLETTKMKEPEDQSWSWAIYSVLKAEKNRSIEVWKNQLEKLPVADELGEFVQTQQVKLAWGQRKKAEALGGYQVLKSRLSPLMGRSLASDLCYSEITSDCAVKSYSFCEDLRESLTGEDSSEIRPEWILALAEERTCRKSVATSFAEVAHDLDLKSDWGRLLLAVIPESKWSLEKRQQALRELAFDSSKSAFIRSRASFHLFQNGAEMNDLEQTQKLLSQSGVPFKSELNDLFQRTSKKMGGESSERKPASVDP